MRWLLFILVFTCRLGFAQSIPMEDEAFTKIAAERLSKELPDYKLQTVGKLSIEGKRADAESTGQINLDRVYAYCARNAENCSSALDQFSKGIAESVKERNRPIEPGMVRVAVRSVAYAEQLRKLTASSGGTFYTKDVAPGIVAIAVLDFSRSVRYVNNKDLEKLALSESELFQLGEKNLRTTSKPLSEVTPVPKTNALGTIVGEDYAPSRILFHDDWKTLNTQLNNKLVVMVPAPDVLLYADGSITAGVDALRTLGADVARKSGRPLSLALFQWTDSGWEVVK